MWGQPPSAVRASEARRGFLFSFPELKLATVLSSFQTPLPPQLLLDFRQGGASLRGQPRAAVPTFHSLCPKLFIGASFLIFSAMTSRTLSHSAPSTDGFFPSVCARSCWIVVFMTTE